MTTCLTNRCSQGHAPCPTPGVCSGNTHPVLPAQPPEADQHRDVDEASIWVLAAACLFSVVALISAAAGYLTVRL